MQKPIESYKEQFATGGANIDFTFDDNFNNREDALTKQTVKFWLSFARTPQALKKRVDIVDEAISNLVGRG